MSLIMLKHLRLYLIFFCSSCCRHHVVMYQDHVLMYADKGTLQNRSLCVAM
jgi:hypothetical protein